MNRGLRVGNGLGLGGLGAFGIKGGYVATPPTIVITSTASTITAAAFTCTFTLSDASIDFAIGDITVGNGTAGTFAGSGSSYTAVITPTATGAVTVDVAAGAFHDALGDASLASNTFSILYVAAAAWFDFSDITTLYQTQTTATPVTADGQSIGYATDKSGNSGRQAIQATAGSRPTYKTGIQNSKSIARFDGGDGLLTGNFSLVQPETVFIVFDVTTWASLKGIIDGIPDPNMMLLQSTNTDNGDGRMSAGTVRVVTGGMPKTAWQLVTALFSGAASYYRLNGTQKDAGDVGTNNASGVTLGNIPYLTGGFTGDIGEVLIFSTTPSDAARASIEAYLNAKWALGF